MSKSKITTVYHETTLDTLARYFVDGFDAGKDMTMEGIYLNPEGKVCIKIHRWPDGEGPKRRFPEDY